MTKREPLDLLRGLFILFFCNLMYCVVVWLLLWIPVVGKVITWWFSGDEYALLGFLIVAILATGLVQLFYAIPLYRRYKRIGRPEIANGIAIAAGLTLFVSASCFFTMFTFS